MTKETKSSTEDVSETILSRAMPSWDGYESVQAEEEARRLQQVVAYQRRLRGLIDGNLSLIEDATQTSPDDVV